MGAGATATIIVIIDTNDIATVTMNMFYIAPVVIDMIMIIINVMLVLLMDILESSSYKDYISKL